MTRNFPARLENRQEDFEKNFSIKKSLKIKFFSKYSSVLGISFPMFFTQQVYVRKKLQQTTRGKSTNEKRIEVHNIDTT